MYLIPTRVFLPLSSFLSSFLFFSFVIARLYRNKIQSLYSKEQRDVGLNSVEVLYVDKVIQNAFFKISLVIFLSPLLFLVGALSYKSEIVFKSIILALTGLYIAGVLNISYLARLRANLKSDSESV